MATRYVNQERITSYIVYDQHGEMCYGWEDEDKARDYCEAHPGYHYEEHTLSPDMGWTRCY